MVCDKLDYSDLDHAASDGSIPMDRVAAYASAIVRLGCDKTTRRGSQFRYSEVASSPRMKNIRLYRNRNRAHIFAHPVPLRGALAIVANVGRGCDGRKGLRMTSACLSVRRRRVVPTPRMLASKQPKGLDLEEATVTTSTARPGRARYKS
jgi:hypothetical protein